MERDERHGRRVAGGIYLAVALLMVILGMTALDGRLKGYWFAIYWMVCLGSTAMAAGIALLEMRAVREDARDEQHELMSRLDPEVRRLLDEARREPPKDVL